MTDQIQHRQWGPHEVSGHKTSLDTSLNLNVPNNDGAHLGNP